MANFPSFSEGLSLRVVISGLILQINLNFPSFSEGLSLRGVNVRILSPMSGISLPVLRDFH